MIADRKQTLRFLIKELRSQANSTLTKAYGIASFPDNSIKTILDIGANIGFYSTGFRFFHANARIVAIEPDKGSFKLLTNNTKGLEIECYNIALGNGEKVFKKRGRNSLCHSYTECKEGAGNEACSLTLQQIIDEFKISTDGLFIKVDCEGGEKHLFGDATSERILRETVGFGFEFHANILKVGAEEGKQWFNTAFGNTHDIFFQTFKHALYARAFRKEFRIGEGVNRDVVF